MVVLESADVEVLEALLVVDGAFEVLMVVVVGVVEVVVVLVVVSLTVVVVMEVVVVVVEVLVVVVFALFKSIKTSRLWLALQVHPHSPPPICRPRPFLHA